MEQAEATLVAVSRLFIAVASLMEEHSLQQLQPGGSAISALRLQGTGLVAMVHRLRSNLFLNLSPLKTGGFSTTGPPEKSHLRAFGED